MSAKHGRVYQARSQKASNHSVQPAPMREDCSKRMPGGGFGVDAGPGRGQRLEIRSRRPGAPCPTIITPMPASLTLSLTLGDSFYTTTVQVIVGQSKKVFTIHKGVLYNAAPYFRASFEGHFLEGEQVLNVAEELETPVSTLLAMGVHEAHL